MEKKKGSGGEKQGYRYDMLAVVLVPVLVLVAACLLERLEAHVAPAADGAGVRRRPVVRDPEAPAVAPVGATVADETPRRRHLQVVPALATEDHDGPAETEREWARAS